MQNKNLTPSSVPSRYPRCVSSSCPLADKCLRSIAWRELRGDKNCLTVLNPSLVSETADCRYFVGTDPEPCAFGFVGMQKRLYPDQYDRFMGACLSRFGRNGYFLRRRGALAMPPSEQQFVRSVLKRVGAPDGLDFDRYEDRLNWDGNEEE